MIKKGLLKAFDAGTYLASVQISESFGVALDNIPTSRGIPSAEMVVDRNVAVYFNDTSNYLDAAVIAVWT